MSTTNTVTPQTSQQLLDSYAREMILLAGKDSVGKSCAVVSIAAYVSLIWPDATFHVIDSEGKFGSAMRSFGSDAPGNIQYWPICDMNQATLAARTIVGTCKPGDWLAIESIASIWERAQNLAYEAVTGVGKIEYLDMKLNTATPTGVVRKASPIPKPDDFWAVAKGAYDAAFLDLVKSCSTLNIVLTTTVKPPPKPREGQRDYDSKDRAIMRAELGIDLNIGGSPALPYYPETLCLLELAQGKVTCRVLRDNNSMRDNTRPVFAVPDRKSWAMAFWSECR